MTQSMCLLLWVSSSSSRTHVINHNWSAMKQSSSTECSWEKPPSSFVGTGFDHVGYRLGLATRTQISVCKSPFPSAGAALSLFRAKMVQLRPLLPREIETRLPDCGSHTRSELTTWADFQLWLHQLLMSTGWVKCINSLYYIFVYESILNVL